MEHGLRNVVLESGTYLELIFGKVSKHHISHCLPTVF